MDIPSNSIVPELGEIRFVRRYNNWLLPAAVGPIIAVLLPALI
jgi:hypothetical protein